MQGGAFYDHLLAGGKSEHTAETYAWHVVPWLRFCGEQGRCPEQADKALCERYIAGQVRKYSSGTAHVRLAALKCWFEWLVGCGVRSDNPAGDLRIKKIKRRPKPPLSRDELAAMYRAAKNEEERLMLEVMAVCGLRIGELAGIAPEHVDVGQGQLLIYGKGGKERWVAPPACLLERLIRLSDGEGRIWPYTTAQIRRILGRIAKNAGVKGFYPHKLRITFANRFWLETHDLLSLQILMGHASADMTAHYTGYSAETQALAQMRTISY